MGRSNLPVIQILTVLLLAPLLIHPNHVHGPVLLAQGMPIDIPENTNMDVFHLDSEALPVESVLTEEAPPLPVPGVDVQAPIPNPLQLSLFGLPMIDTEASDEEQ